MERIPARTLNQDTASVLARVESGETIEITKRGQTVARIVPATGTGELDDWIAEGRVAPATLIGPMPMPRQEVIGEEAGELVRQLRDEERW